MRRRATLAALCATLCCGSLAAQPAAAPEHALKAVLLFKLPLFVYRAQPPGGDSVVLCVLGHSGLEDALQELAATPIDGRRVELRTLQSGAGAQGCELLFIGRSESRRLADLLDAVKAATAVTVSDIEGFAAAGGMVELGVRGEGKGLAIIINRRAARAHGIEFNAQLLRLARTVGD
jgi:hypothetical protein